MSVIVRRFSAAYIRWPEPSPSAANLTLPMNADLIKAAGEVIPNPQILVNMVSRRVRQLSFGHRPLVQVPPGMRAADIALTEIVEKKLAYESTFGQDEAGASVVAFPATGVAVGKAA